MGPKHLPGTTDLLFIILTYIHLTEGVIKLSVWLTLEARDYPSGFD